jgi:hypothetical protein
LQRYAPWRFTIVYLATACADSLPQKSIDSRKYLPLLVQCRGVDFLAEVQLFDELIQQIGSSKVLYSSAAEQIPGEAFDALANRLHEKNVEIAQARAEMSLASASPPPPPLVFSDQDSVSSDESNNDGKPTGISGSSSGSSSSSGRESIVDVNDPIVAAADIAQGRFGAIGEPAPSVKVVWRSPSVLAAKKLLAEKEQAAKDTEAKRKRRFPYRKVKAPKEKQDKKEDVKEAEEVVVVTVEKKQVTKKDVVVGAADVKQVEKPKKAKYTALWLKGR